MYKRWLTYFSTSLFLLRIFMVLLSRPRKVKPYLQVDTYHHRGNVYVAVKCVIVFKYMNISHSKRVQLLSWQDVLPHGPFHQCNLIRWGGYKASMFLLWMGHISIWNDVIHLINLSLLDLPLLCWLLHLDRVAETQRTQEQILPFLKDGLDNQVLTKNKLSNHQQTMIIAQ